MRPIRVATRRSAQATAQATIVADALTAAGWPADLVLVDTEGDRTQSDNVPLHTIGGQGVFTKEVQRAVLDGRADVAVHSAKDLTTDSVKGLTIAAYTERRTAADALVGRSLADLPFGATIATGSVRRRAQLRRARHDLAFEELRGNIATRLDKVPAGGAIVIAVAALEILGLTEQIATVLDPAEFVPAVGQGCVAVECRTDDQRLGEALSAIDHDQTRAAVTIERAFLNELGSGCSLPVGAHVMQHRLFYFLAADDGSVAINDSVAVTGIAGTDEGVARDAARDARARVASGAG